MRIGIDAHIVAYEPRGIGKYILRLTRGLACLDRENSYFVYGPRDVLKDGLDSEKFVVRETGRWPYLVWEQCVLPYFASRDELDILHCPANTGPLRLDGRVRLVMTIHDLMCMLPASIIPAVETVRQRLGKFYRRTVVPRVIKSAHAVLTDSEFSKQDIIKYLSIEASRVRVVYPAMSEETDERCDLTALTPWLPPWESHTGFILALGGYDPRKSTEMVIRVYADLRLDHDIPEKLVVIGLPGWRSSRFFRLARELKVDNDVYFAGFVPDPVLHWFYRSASCFLYPSLYEGFGYPPLEAMVCGTPVITSNVASIPEVVGDAAILVNPTNPESIREGLLRVLSDESLRKDMIERGRLRAARFRWQTMVEQTLQVYQETFASRGTPSRPK